MTIRGCTHLAIAISAFVGWLQIVFGQGITSEDGAVPIISVCEALSDRARFNGKSIVVVGRFGYTDEGTWLSEECDRKIVTGGYTWANIISTTYARSDVFPPPGIPKTFRWDDKLLAGKLREVKKTTKLRILKQYNYSDKWMAIFGRFETRVPLQVGIDGRGKLRGDGFGHLSGAPAQLVSGENASRELK